MPGLRCQRRNDVTNLELSLPLQSDRSEFPLASDCHDSIVGSLLQRPHMSRRVGYKPTQPSTSHPSSPNHRMCLSTPTTFFRPFPNEPNACLLPTAPTPHPGQYPIQPLHQIQVPAAHVENPRYGNTSPIVSTGLTMPPLQSLTQLPSHTNMHRQHKCHRNTQRLRCQQVAG